MKPCPFLVIISTLLFYQCQRVIDLKLEDTIPRLVVDAKVSLERETTGYAKVILTRVSSYYNKENTFVKDAQVSIKNESSEEIYQLALHESEADGVYFYKKSIPLEQGQVFSLKIIHNDQTYIAQTTIESAVKINSVTQEFIKRSFQSNSYLVKVKINNRKNIADYVKVQFRILKDHRPLYTFRLADDRFYNGEEIEILEDFSLDDLQGEYTPIEISISRVNESYYRYVSIILDQAKSDSNEGSPFQTSKATVRGNIFNQTNPNDFALGFFYSELFSSTNFQIIRNDNN